MKKFFSSLSIYHLLLVSLISKIISYYFFADHELANEWEKLIHNKEISGIFGFYIASGEYIAHPKLAEAGDKVLPSVFMPPLYYYFIYILKLLSLDFFSLSNQVIFFQIILSLVSIYIFSKILIKFTTKEISMVITSVFAFFPMNILAVSQISSITIQIFLLLNFFFFLVEFIFKKKKINLIIFSLFSGLLILIRGEFFLFYLITILYFFIYYEKDFKTFFITMLITFLVISPYLHRNLNLFNTITLTKSFGYNLLKGNNPNLIVEGDAKYVENNFPRTKLKIKTNNQYEINLDNFYRDEAIENIKKDPGLYLKFYFIKVISFLFLDFNSSYPNYYNFFHIFPKLALSIISFIGAITLIKKRGFFQYLSLFYFSNIFLFSIFFILPRYSLILLPIQLILSLNILKKILGKLMN
jgi:hypothetical protein